MNLGISLAFAAFLGLLPAMIAQRKGRCFFDWWLYGMGFFIVALPHALLIRPDKRPCLSVGVLLLATFRRQGFGYFASDPTRFAGSLVPLVVFPLIGGLAMAGSAGDDRFLAEVMASVCAMLLPPVMTWEFARYWGRQAEWLRFATASNWCQWAVMAVAMVLLFAIVLTGGSGLTSRIMLIGGLVAYALCLNWFLARHGLGLSPGRSAAMVLSVNLATALMVFGSRLLVADRA